MSIDPKSFSTTVIEDLLKQSNKKLDSIDKSIDYLAAAMTGEDPLHIQLGQAAYGRLQSLPRVKPGEFPRRGDSGASVRERLINIDMKLVEEVLEKMIKEELEVILTDDEAVEMFGEQITEGSLNPEWDKARQIKSDLVYLADDLEKIEDTVLVRAIVEDLRLAVDAMGRRMNEKFGTLQTPPEFVEEEL